MTLPLILFWVVGVSLCTVLASYYARTSGRSDALVALYVTLVITSNLVASKIIGFDLGITTLFAPAATLLFSVTFLLIGIVTEKFGRPEAQRMIYVAFFSQLAFLLFSYMALKATPAPFFTNQAAFDAVLGATPRIGIAGLVTFLISESLDAYLFAKLRAYTHEKYLWMRGAFSSIPAMFIDSVLFITLAFYGTQPILQLIIGLIIIKWLVGVIDIPFMYMARSILRKG